MWYGFMHVISGGPGHMRCISAVTNVNGAQAHYNKSTLVCVAVCLAVINNNVVLLYFDIPSACRVRLKTLVYF